MTRDDAKKLAETVTDTDIAQMFINAQNGIKDWTKVSRVNKGLTKGVGFNILSKCGPNVKDKLITTNQIWEFGEWLPNYEKEIIVNSLKQKPSHQEPIKLEDGWFEELFK